MGKLNLAGGDDRALNLSGCELALKCALRANTYALPEDTTNKNETWDQKLRRYLASDNFNVTLIDAVPVADNNTKKAAAASITESEVTFAIEKKSDGSVKFMKGRPAEEGKHFTMDNSFYTEREISNGAKLRWQEELSKRAQPDSPGLTDRSNDNTPITPNKR